MLPYACCGLHFIDSAACVLSFDHSTPLQLWRCESRISGAATRDLSSQRQQQRPILTMNAADNPGQPPAPPTLHSLRPHKLRRFSGDEGDAAEDFVREAKLFLELGPMADPAAAAWLREGSGQAGSAVHGGRRSQHPWQNLRHPGAALGRTSRLLHPCWGVLQAPAGAHRVGGGVRRPPTFVSSGRKPMLSRRAPSPLSCCGTPLRVGFIPCL